MSLVGFKAQNHTQQVALRGAADVVDDRGTDPEFFAKVAAEFGPFTLDVAAATHNAKCERYFTLQNDGLTQSWAGERVWCNPPYSDLGAWVRKAWTERYRAPMHMPLMLCGTEFGLRDGRWWLRRHRLFESNIDLWGAGGCHCNGKPVAGIYGHSDGPVYKEGRKDWSAPSEVARRLLDTPWITNRHALAQAIPPAYTEHVGAQLLEHLRGIEAAA